SSKLTVKGERGLAQGRTRGDDGSRLTDAVRLERDFIETRRIERLRRGGSGSRIAGALSLIEHRLRDGTVDQAGIEITQAIVSSRPFSECALTGRGRTVDGNDHERSAPIECISSTKPGKLVAMNALSSIRT